jgi:hypothetical protein
MPPRPAKQVRGRPRAAPIVGPVPAFVDGFYWYFPVPGDPWYDAWAPADGAEVVHVTPLATRTIAWFAGNPDSYAIGADGYLPEQFVGPLLPPRREGDVDGSPSS